MEFWDAYDEKMNMIPGKTLIRDEKRADGIFHFVSAIIVRHTDGTYLLMQRDPRKHFGGMWEATAGGSTLKGETPEECGRRELLEEAGVIAEKFTPLGVMYPSPGYTGENIYMFLAENITRGKENPDEDEFLEQEWVPFDKFLEKCLSGSINDAKTVVCMARAQNILQRKNK